MPQIHSKNTDTVFHTTTMDSARQKAVLTYMSGKSAQQGFIRANIQSLDKITSHCHRPLNKAQTLAQTHRSQLESSDSIVTPIKVQQLQNYLSRYNQATSGVFFYRKLFSRF